MQFFLQKIHEKHYEKQNVNSGWTRLLYDQRNMAKLKGYEQDSYFLISM